MLVKVLAIPPAAFRRRPKDKIVLAWGEQTGHRHWISANLAMMFVHEGAIYIHAKPGAKLTHDEHDPIQLKPGAYKLVRQRQFVYRTRKLTAEEMQWMD